MYGLKQAGIIAHQALVKNLAQFGYHPFQFMPGLWRHDTQDTLFTLVVDDFAMQYKSLENAKHLLDALKKKGISEDWEANIYIGISLKWDYVQRNMDYTCQYIYLLNWYVSAIWHPSYVKMRCTNMSNPLMELPSSMPQPEIIILSCPRINSNTNNRLWVSYYIMASPSITPYLLPLEISLQKNLMPP